MKRVYKMMGYDFAGPVHTTILPEPARVCVNVRKSRAHIRPARCAGDL